MNSPLYALGSSDNYSTLRKFNNARRVDDAVEVRRIQSSLLDGRGER